jgi:hypothetical protein
MTLTVAKRFWRGVSDLLTLEFQDDLLGDSARREGRDREGYGGRAAKAEEI